MNHMNFILLQVIIFIVEINLNVFAGDATLEFEEIPYDDLTVHMRGHGYSFRRSLDSDIDKLLA